MARVLGFAAWLFSTSVLAAVDWQDWSAETFASARTDNKLIFVDVGMEGCTACRNMDEVTFTDPEVQRLLNTHFVPISVDSEARPDVGERYSDWAWPALIFMAPDATQVLAIRGNRRPENFIPILERLLEEHNTGKLEPDALAPYAAPPAPADTDLITLRGRIRGQLDRSLNEQDGGWNRRGISLTSGPRLRNLMMRADMYANAELEAIALRTADRFLEALDPVWGGAYNGVFGAGRFIPEKRITPQANAMWAFADAYQITGEPRYREGMLAVHAYLANWMASPRGTFYTSQEDRPVDYAGSTRDYWQAASDAERRKHGIPPIDRAVYTDKNGQMIAAYAQAFEATGHAPYLAAARTAARSLIATRQTEAGWMLQTQDSPEIQHGERMRPHATATRPFLAAQAWFGTAVLALYRVTADDTWLATANTIGEQLLITLEDPAVGGFFATTPDATDQILGGRKPLEQNARAAHFLYDLWVYTKDDRFAEPPRRAVLASASPEAVRREGRVTGELGVALEKLSAGYVEFSVVGDPADPRAAALFDAGMNVYQPRKLLHYEAPGRYPDRGKPSMYICNPDVCSVPIEDPADVSAQTALIRPPATSHLVKAVANAAR